MAVSTWSTGRAAPTNDRSDDLVIDPSGSLRAGRRVTTFVLDDDGSFLVAYLKLVRRLRRQKAEPLIELRRAEIELLADHLDADPVDILDRLGALMGASITQRRVLAASFAAGAVVLFVAVGASAAISGGGVPSATTLTITARNAEPTAVVAGELTELHDALPLIVIASASPDRSADVLSAPDLATVVVAPPSDTATSPATPPADAPPAAAADDASVDADDTSTPVEVAVGEPPVPTPPFEVAVGEPPVPTPPFEVAVGEPPVPSPPSG